MVPSGDRWAFLRRDRHLFLASAVVSAGAGEVGTLPSRGPERCLVPAARLDELLGGAATVGVGVGHGAAQFLDGRCLRCGLSGSLAFPAVQVVFGGLAGGEEKPAGRSGAMAVAGNRDHAGRVSVTAPVFPVRAVLPCVLCCAHRQPRVSAGQSSASAGRVAVTARGQDMHAVAVPAAMRGAHQAAAYPSGSYRGTGCRSRTVRG